MVNETIRSFNEEKNVHKTSSVCFNSEIVVKIVTQFILWLKITLNEDEQHFATTASSSTSTTTTTTSSAFIHHRRCCLDLCFNRTSFGDDLRTNQTSFFRKVTCSVVAIHHGQSSVRMLTTETK